MKSHFKHIVASLLLLLFLLPTTEQTLHALHHRNDVHCNVVSEKHFHQQEHHCQLCDFNTVNKAEFTSEISFSKLSVFVNKISVYQFTPFSSIASNPFGARPPPTIG